MYKSSVFLLLVFASILMPGVIVADEKIPFVIQLTRAADNYGHRRAFLQIDRVLDDLDEERLKFEVVAYEDGIHALLADNQETSQLLTKLANRGVTFKACRISMNAWRLTEDQFPLEVEFVPAGAPEVIRLQMKSYKYWRP
jgi:intracellular sulfur oxidation DsrE/DsrF family protein